MAESRWCYAHPRHFPRLRRALQEERADLRGLTTVTALSYRGTQLERTERSEPSR